MGGPSSHATQHALMMTNAHIQALPLLQPRRNRPVVSLVRHARYTPVHTLERSGRIQFHRTCIQIHRHPGAALIDPWSAQCGMQDTHPYTHSHALPPTARRCSYYDRLGSDAWSAWCGMQDTHPYRHSNKTLCRQPTLTLELHFD
jgi:hypothetical protein